jgi:hypothetical protein
MPTKPKPKRKPAGRPALPEDQRSRSVNTSIRAEVFRWLEEIGGGSASRGARVAVETAWNSRQNQESAK